MKKIVKSYIYRISNREVTDDEELIYSGILDSFNVLELIDYIEEYFNIQFKLEELKEISNFSSVNAICSILNKKVNSRSKNE